MEEEPSLVTTTLTAADEGEYSLRPKTLKEYIGQEKAKGNLEVFIQAAKMRRWTMCSSTALPALEKPPSAALLLTRWG